MKGSNPNKRTHSRPGGVVGRTRGGRSAGTRIIAAIEEATEILRTEGLESKRLTIRNYAGPPAPHVCNSADVKRLREVLALARRYSPHFWVLMSTLFNLGSRASACRSRSPAAFLRKSNRTPGTGDSGSGEVAVAVDARKRTED